MNRRKAFSIRGWWRDLVLFHAWRVQHARLDEIRATLPGHREAAVRVQAFAATVVLQVDRLPDGSFAPTDLLERAALVVEAAELLNLLDDPHVLWPAADVVPTKSKGGTHD